MTPLVVRRARPDRPRGSQTCCLRAGNAALVAVGGTEVPDTMLRGLRGAMSQRQASRARSWWATREVTPPLAPGSARRRPSGGRHADDAHDRLVQLLVGDPKRTTT